LDWADADGSLGYHGNVRLGTTIANAIPLDKSIPSDELIQGHDPNHPISTPTDTPNEYDYIKKLLYNDYLSEE